MSIADSVDVKRTSSPGTPSSTSPAAGSEAPRRSLFDFQRNKKPPRDPAYDNQGFYTTPPAAAAGWYWTPRVASINDWPLDVDGGLRHQRPKTGIDYWGEKPIQQLTPEQRYMAQHWMTITFPTTFHVAWTMAYAKPPSGPIPFDQFRFMTPWNYSQSFTAVQMPLAPKQT